MSIGEKVENRVKRCIYCFGRDDGKDDWPGEHVLPAQLGGPDRYQLYRQVCPTCNNIIGSRLESFFKEETPEGYLAGVYNLGRGSGYMTSGRRLKVEISAEGFEFSPDMFPRADLKSKSLSLPPQVTYKAGSKRYTTFKDLKAKELKKKLAWLRSSEIEAISYHKAGDDPFPGVSAEGLDIGKPSQTPIAGGVSTGPVMMKFESVIDRSIKRVVARIAYNYFAWCSLPAFDAVVYDNRFASLRKFVLLPDDQFEREFGLERTLVTVEEKPIIFDGQKLRPGYPYHLLRIRRQYVYCNGVPGHSDGYYWTLVAEVNLFSARHYVVRLSFYPFDVINRARFGCGHVIDLANNKWIRVDENGDRSPPDDFVLFR